ncbi:hypothetical protein GF361_01215 [Candidatus Woesearchaeota archaeon]|nr:hypothetical protein [Candidatus Woesearchaeota archaeon]
MPQGDRTGPNGQGPMTGRGMGFCNGFSAPGYANPGFGRGRGFGRATAYNPRGMLRPRFAVAPAQVTPVYREPATEKEALKQEAKAIEEEQKILKQEMDDIKKRLEEIKKQK